MLAYFRWELIRDPFGNSAEMLLPGFFPRDINNGENLHSVYEDPTAILDSLLYLSEETFILAIARTIRITPAGVVVGKIRRFADTASSSGCFDTRHEHEFVQTAKTSAFEGGKRKRLGDNKRKRADGGRWRRAKVTLL